MKIPIHAIDKGDPPALAACYAKSRLLPDGRTVAGVDVLTHCRIVGMVAERLIQRLGQLEEESLYPHGSALIAAVHDVGKISPTFQEKIRRSFTGYEK